MRTPTPGRVAAAAVFALSLGPTIVVLLQGFDPNYPMRLIEGAAVVIAGAAVVFGPILWIALRMAGWRHPEDEDEFERVVLRSEELAAAGVEDEPGEEHWLDPYDDYDFRALVRDALDELPPELRGPIERSNVAVVIADDGARRHAYGLYHGDGVARDNVPDRVVIYRDTLLRDFGHDPDALRDQVVRTVRHELAHHLGWNELGVRGLGL
ncbi:MAG TPA: metallopeptidase family protein [Solirubrobacteraceae bacterium]|nr:metallopeptidase family protein [Solirubrobacteraceae bacterium]